MSDFVDKAIAWTEIAIKNDEIDKLRKALEFIRDGYDRLDINHVDYRVGAYKAALDALARVGGVK